MTLSNENTNGTAPGDESPQRDLEAARLGSSNLPSAISFVTMFAFNLCTKAPSFLVQSIELILA